ncbi:MAG TPA: hypothetical protein VMW48_10720 [Vicinamibacterales bacterium]|nr:hypothetical protein [Vicinamibacterales bacterium]
MSEPIIGDWHYLHHGQVFVCLGTSAIGHVLAVVRYAPTSEDDPRPWSCELLPALGGWPFARRCCLKSVRAAKWVARRALVASLTEEVTA